MMWDRPRGTVSRHSPVKLLSLKKLAIALANIILKVARMKGVEQSKKLSIQLGKTVWTFKEVYKFSTFFNRLSFVRGLRGRRGLQWASLV